MTQLVYIVWECFASEYSDEIDSERLYSIHATRDKAEAEAEAMNNDTRAREDDGNEYVVTSREVEE